MIFLRGSAASRENTFVKFKKKLPKLDGKGGEKGERKKRGLCLLRVRDKEAKEKNGKKKKKNLIQRYSPTFSCYVRSQFFDSLSRVGLRLLLSFFSYPLRHKWRPPEKELTRSTCSTGGKREIGEREKDRERSERDCRKRPARRRTRRPALSFQDSAHAPYSSLRSFSLPKTDFGSEISTSSIDRPAQKRARKG